MSKTKKMTFTAVFTAISLVLVFISKQLPSPWTQGGSVTLASMVPIILVSILIGVKWGIASGLVFSLIQMMTGFYPPPVGNFLNFAGVVLLDYIFAFSFLGLAGFFVKLMGNKAWAIPLSGAIVTCIRYAMHILSGILIWGAFADTNSVAIYSLVYNGTYMVPEIIITTVTLAIIAPKIKGKISL